MRASGRAGEGWSSSAEERSLPSPDFSSSVVRPVAGPPASRARAWRTRSALSRRGRLGVGTMLGGADVAPDAPGTGTGPAVVTIRVGPVGALSAGAGRGGAAGAGSGAGSEAGTIVTRSGDAVAVAGGRGGPGCTCEA